jgi:UDP-glucose 4-epimerase
MRVLLTGASSFTGYWFALKLGAAGFEVTAPLRGTPARYSGVRRERVQRLSDVVELIPNCPFGGPQFMDMVDKRSFDVLCHHAARVTDYRSLDFDVLGAVADNTNNVRSVFERMLMRQLRAIVFTGSVFEANEGAGDLPCRAFSPYGLSKGLTWDIFRHWAIHYRVPLGKFLIANPFGPFEEPRFCAYLIKTWRQGEAAQVRTPSYLRDNIHVDLLALEYVKFVRRTIEHGISEKFGPIGYAESQGEFTQRFAAAMRHRLGWECGVKPLVQTDFSEPLVRINTHVVDAATHTWSESAAWDSVADYYRDREDI